MRIRNTKGELNFTFLHPSAYWRTFTILQNNSQNA
jgi:hypothetical protein